MKRLLFFVGLLTIISIQSQAQTSGGLSISVTTSNAGGEYAPTNILAIWVEDDSGNFVKTLMAYANYRIQYLTSWQNSTSAAGTTYNTTDAITGATRNQHSTRICTWDGTDYDGSAVPDGTYKVCFELTDKNATGNFSEFAFTKSSTPESITPADSDSFNSVSIEWSPSTNIELNKNSNNLHLYPNPTGNKLSIETNYATSGIAEIITYNIQGKMVDNRTIEISKNGITEIDFSQFPSGTYIIRINDKLGKKSYSRFIKK